MAQKGLSTRSEALEFKDFKRLIDGLRADGEYRWELFCFLSYVFALRVSDVLNLRWEHLLGRDSCFVEEIKTRKTRNILIDPKTRSKISELYSLMGCPAQEEYVFINPKLSKVFSFQYINRQLKQFQVRYRLPIRNFSSHTFRKTFGRRVYELNGRTEHSILMVNRALRHQNLATTIIYLGIRQEELDEVYKQAAF